MSLNQEYDVQEYVNFITAKHQCGQDSTITTMSPETTTSETYSTTDTTGPSNTPSGLVTCLEAQYEPSNVTLTEEELQNVLDQIVANLSVNTDDLSKVRRSKISAPDDRASSTTVGLFGISFVGVVLGLVFILDLSKLVSDIRLGFAKMRR